MIKDMLQEKGVDEADIKSIDKEIKEIVNEAAQFAQDSPEPEPEELWTDVYIKHEE